MFKHLLSPTDGSPLSEGAALKSIQFARTLGARVTAVHVSPRFHVLTYRTDMLEDTRAQYEKDSQLQADRYLAFNNKAAAESGDASESVRRISDEIHQSIIEFMGRWYFIYHNGGVQTTGGSFRRSVCIDYLDYNPDGTLKRVVQTSEGVNPAKSK